ncbi:unnamed protein product [Amoebophrya sp. A25]|nr:unnamed protein product [Amoebophrya sp. A25]|eukprot:GSA25T00010473001.1
MSCFYVQMNGKQHEQDECLQHSLAKLPPLLKHDLGHSVRVNSQASTTDGTSTPKLFDTTAAEDESSSLEDESSEDAHSLVGTHENDDQHGQEEEDDAQLLPKADASKVLRYWHQQGVDRPISAEGELQGVLSLEEQEAKMGRERTRASGSRGRSPAAARGAATFVRQRRAKNAASTSRATSRASSAQEDDVVAGRTNRNPPPNRKLCLPKGNRRDLLVEDERDSTCSSPSSRSRGTSRKNQKIGSRAGEQPRPRGYWTWRGVRRHFRRMFGDFKEMHFLMDGPVKPLPVIVLLLLVSICVLIIPGLALTQTDFPSGWLGDMQKTVRSEWLTRRRDGLAGGPAREPSGIALSSWTSSENDGESVVAKILSSAGSIFAGTSNASSEGSSLTLAVSALVQQPYFILAVRCVFAVWGVVLLVMMWLHVSWALRSFTLCSWSLAALHNTSAAGAMLLDMTQGEGSGSGPVLDILVALYEASRYPALLGNLVTFFVWWFAIVPVALVLLGKAREARSKRTSSEDRGAGVDQDSSTTVAEDVEGGRQKTSSTITSSSQTPASESTSKKGSMKTAETGSRTEFLQIILSPVLVQVHGCNVILACTEHFFFNYRTLHLTDWYFGMLFVALYGTFYVFALEMYDIHWYIPFNPRTNWAALGYVAIFFLSCALWKLCGGEMVY